jgi:hypothetical protein
MMAITTVSPLDQTSAVGSAVGAGIGYERGRRYFFSAFLSCFGFLTSFLRTLFPLPMSGFLPVMSAE